MMIQPTAGDEIVAGPTVGRQHRHGQILEVSGGAGHEHYWVRWDDGRQSMFFPGPETRTIHLGDATDQRRKVAQAPASPDTVRRRYAVKLSDPVLRIARYPVETVDSGASLRTVAETLAADDIGALVVVAPHAPAGVISERDIVRFITAGDDLDNAEAADAINADMVFARPEDSIAAVAAMMLESQIRHVPIIRDRTCLVGLVSMRDILRMFADVESHLAAVSHAVGQ